MTDEVMNVVAAYDRDQVRRHVLFGAFSAALLLFSFRTVEKLFALSANWEDKHSTYVILIPFIAVTLIYWDRERIFSVLQTSIGPAVAGFIVSAAIYFIDLQYGGRLDDNDNLSLMTAAVVAAWLAGFMLIYGLPAFRAGLFPLLFLGLTAPMPTRIMSAMVHFLQYGSASLVGFLFALTGTPAYRENVVFVLPGLTIEVAEACSGIRSTLGIFIVTLLASHMLLRSNWRRTALVLAVIPISLFKNGVRIVVLTLLALHLDMRFLTGSLHHDGGILFMLLGLVMMYPVLSLLIRSEARNTASGVRS
jgi:exosortase